MVTDSLLLWAERGNEIVPKHRLETNLRPLAKLLDDLLDAPLEPKVWRWINNTNILTPYYAIGPWHFLANPQNWTPARPYLENWHFHSRRLLKPQTI